MSAIEKPVLTLEERRSKRAAKREKQRFENVGRAAKMHKARLAWKKISLESSLPPSSGKLKIQAGCSGWFYWHWRGGFYPDGLATNKWFGHYSKSFKTVELNAPFYSWPSTGTVQSWIRQAGKRHVVYTVKVSELITHVKKFSGTKTLIQDFGHIADLLGSYMGCFLFQLPPSFHYSSVRLKRIIAQLDPTRRNVVEFRHKSWWNEQVYSAFRKAGIIFCSCSGPGLPDELIKTTDEVYIRFHGVKKWYRHDYSRSELKTWAERIQESQTKTAWIYFNNDRDGYAIKNARTLIALLRRDCEKSNLDARLNRRSKSFPGHHAVR